MFKHRSDFGIYTFVNRILAYFAGLVVMLGLIPAQAANTEATLILSAQTARPGDTIMAAVRLNMASGWHTYWKNSGASGIATSIKWTLPPGITAGEIRWPVPEKYVPQKVDEDGKAIPGALDYEQTTYVYHDEAALLVPLTIASNASAGKIEIKARVDWLECQINCIPGKQDVTATLEVADRTTPSSAADLFAQWEARLPRQAPTNLTARAVWESPATERGRRLLLQWQFTPGRGSWDFFPYSSDDFEVQHATELVATNNNKVTIRKWVTQSGATWPQQVSGLLVEKRDGHRTGYEVQLPVTEEKLAVGGMSSGSVAPLESKPLFIWLLYAFVGGLILNVMPCVLPVIALKIMGFVGQAKEAPGRVRLLGLVYGAGVLISFLVLALVVVGVKAAGQKAGWGMQFSNPIFIVAMTTLITLVALNLFGVFEVSLGGRVMNAAGDAASQHGASGAFFNGVLATALSTPCSAPFLGAALGFAFAQPASIIILILLTVGLGLAAPYVVLSWQPAWLKFMPKPGAWMEKFKIAMGFPMLATAVWLASLVETFYGEQSWWLGVFLVLLGAAAWVFGEFFQRMDKKRWLSGLITVLLLGGGYLWALESGLNWRHPQSPEAATAKLANAPKGYDWERWSPEAVANARAQGRVVVVDFTASWCQTCKISVKPGFEAKSVVAKLKELNAVALVADYTTFSDAITTELEKYGRSAVPMVLVYPANANEPAMVLPEPLPFPAPYAPVILNALEKT